MTIELPEEGAKTYLAAIGAIAIYVSIDRERPINVGVARDLDKALTHQRRIISRTIALSWVAWGKHFQKLSDIAQTPGLMLTRRPDDGVNVTLQADELAAKIVTLAGQSGLVLTPHARVLERARAFSGLLDEAMEALKEKGHLAEFNQAYKRRRDELRLRSESIQPYWAALQELRAVVVRVLVAQPNGRLVTTSVLVEIRKRFPWFNADAGSASARRQAGGNAAK
jgi:hypothetical protein